MFFSRRDFKRPVGHYRAVFERARVNGACYDGDKLPAQSFEFPSNTFLQRRRAALRADQLGGAAGALVGAGAVTCQRCSEGSAEFVAVSDVAGWYVCRRCADIALSLPVVAAQVGALTVVALGGVHASSKT